MYLSNEKKEKLLTITEIIDKGFVSQHQYYKRFIAINGLKVKGDIDVERIKELVKFIRKQTSMFSPFRTNAFVLSSLIYMNSKKPEDVINRLFQHYEVLKTGGFKKTTFLPMTSYALENLMFDSKIQDMAIQTDSYRESLVESAKEIYDKMRQDHPWLTGGDDYPLALLIAHSGKPYDRIESLYERLHEEGFKKGNNLQSLANILSLSDFDEDVIVHKASDIMTYLKGNSFRVNQTMYPGIGLLALVTEQEEHLEHVMEVTKELKALKKYKWLDKNLLFMFAVNLVSEDLKTELSTKTITETTLSITIEQLVMAQTAVMVAAISASTTAATAGS